ncbi:MAG: hypothetical protein IPK26_12470 [Planctomycetes bacterium]|nr:hypothetical protein [Planctomycetota bacterium]
MYAPGQFRQLVAAGYSPADRMAYLAVTAQIAALPVDVLLERWRTNVVAGRTTDWRLCPGCAEGASKFVQDRDPLAAAIDALYHAEERGEAAASYRLVGEESAGVEVTVRGLRKLILGPTLRQGAWECCLGKAGPWLPVGLLRDSLLVAMPTAAVAPRQPPPLPTTPPSGGGDAQRPNRAAMEATAPVLIVAPPQVEAAMAPPEKSSLATQGNHHAPIVAAGAASSHEHAFRDLVAEQLRRSPWLGLLLAMHGVAIVALWLLSPVANEAVRSARTAIVLNPADVVVLSPQATLPPINAETSDVPTELEAQLLSEEAQIPFVDEIEPFTDFEADEIGQDETGWGAAIAPTGRIGAEASARVRRKQASNPAFAAAIDAGLRWLRNHQDEDGRWDCGGFMKHDKNGVPGDGGGNAAYDVGVTALALLAFLGDGHTLREGTYRDVVQKAVKWLRSQQQPVGRFGAGNHGKEFYNHAVASYAICEAQGLSGYESLRPMAQMALDYLVSRRNPGAAWRYSPFDRDNDLSVTGWCIMACKSGQHFGLQVDPEALAQPERWIDSVTDEYGVHEYMPGWPWAREGEAALARYPGDKCATMTAVGLFCRFFLGQDQKRNPCMRLAADEILSKPPTWDEAGGSIDCYYWYYATYALYQMGGARWDKWRQPLTTAVVRTQIKDGRRPNVFGSWDPHNDVWGEAGGRVYMTAMLTLTLEAYYRYTRLIR